MNDIFDGDQFIVDMFHTLETDPVSEKPFRWSDCHFYIIPKKSVQNVCIRFVCIGGDKKLIVFYENKTKNLKYELSIKSGTEYILFIPVSNKDSISFFVTPNIPTTNGDTRTLGLYVKQIYVSSTQNDKLLLMDTLNTDFNSFESTEYGHQEQKIIVDELPCKEQEENVEIIPFNYNKKNQFYNSSLFLYNNLKYIMARHSTWVNKNVMMSSLRLFKYDGLCELNLNIIDDQDYQQYDDPRVLVYDDKLYVSCATYTHEKHHIVHQKILVLDNKFNHVGNIHPVYGYNGRSIEENTGKEKNWTFFIHDNKLMCVYNIHPHTVVEFDWEGNVVSEYVTHYKHNWKYGKLRGGTNPIFKDGYYHSFFHSSVPWKHEHRRRYFMGHYKFESHPPFRIVEISEEPILWGNEQDERILPDISPLVVFPCGSILENNKFEVSFGLNDEKTGVITL